MVSSSSNCSRTCSPRWTLRRFLCSMTLARNSLRCRAYASSDSRLCRVIMPLFYESGLDFREGERHLALAHRQRALQPRAAVRQQEPMQLDQRLAVHLALELDHRLERHPVFVPAPGVELGMAAGAQLDVAVAARHAQQVPDLLLAAVRAVRLPRATR